MSEVAQPPQAAAMAKSDSHNKRQSLHADAPSFVPSFAILPPALPGHPRSPTMGMPHSASSPHLHADAPSFVPHPPGAPMYPPGAGPPPPQQGFAPYAVFQPPQQYLPPMPPPPAPFFDPTVDSPFANGALDRHVQQPSRRPRPPNTQQQQQQWQRGPPPSHDHHADLNPVASSFQPSFPPLPASDMKRSPSSSNNGHVTPPASVPLSSRSSSASLSASGKPQVEAFPALGGPNKAEAKRVDVRSYAKVASKPPPPKPRSPPAAPKPKAAIPAPPKKAATTPPTVADGDDGREPAMTAEAAPILDEEPAMRDTAVEVSNRVEQLVEAASNVAESVQDKVEDLVEGAKEAVGSSEPKQETSTAQDVVETASEAAQNTFDRVAAAFSSSTGDDLSITSGSSVSASPPLVDQAKDFVASLVSSEDESPDTSRDSVSTPEEPATPVEAETSAPSIESAEPVPDVLADSADAVRSLVRKAGDAVGDLSERAGETAGDIQQVAADVGERAEQARDRATEATSDAIESVTEIVSDAAAQGQDVASDATERAQDVAADATERVQEAAGEVVERTQEVASDMAERVKASAGDAMERVKDVASEAAERVSDVAGDVAERAQDVTADAVEQAREAASDTAERVQEAAGDIIHTASKLAADAVQQMQEVVADMPDDAPTGVDAPLDSVNEASEHEARTAVDDVSSCPALADDTPLAPSPSPSPPPESQDTNLLLERARNAIADVIGQAQDVASSVVETVETRAIDAKDRTIEAVETIEARSTDAKDRALDGLRHARREVELRPAEDAEELLEVAAQLEGSAINPAEPPAPVAVEAMTDGSSSVAGSPADARALPNSDEPSVTANERDAVIQQPVVEAAVSTSEAKDTAEAAIDATHATGEAPRVVSQAPPPSSKPTPTANPTSAGMTNWLERVQQRNDESDSSDEEGDERRKAEEDPRAPRNAEEPPSLTLSLFNSPGRPFRERILAVLGSLGINVLLPFVNGVMLGFGEIFAREYVALWFGIGPAVRRSPQTRTTTASVGLRAAPRTGDMPGHPAAKTAAEGVGAAIVGAASASAGAA